MRRRGLLLSGASGARTFSSKLLRLAALGALCSCSSDIELKPLDEYTSEAVPTGATASSGGTAGAAATAPAPAPSSGAGGSESLPPTMLQPDSGGTSSSSGASSGGAAAPDTPSPAPEADGGSAAAPDLPSACSDGDADGDGRCDADDVCANVADDGTDRDRDGVPDACDGCPDLAGANAPDSDGDGIPDACDPCGIGAVLQLAPLFYFPLDEGPLAAEAVNLGTVDQRATYIGPVERGLAGVSDPAGTSVRMIGQQNGQFSRLTVLNASAFPSTALTATFWIRTNQTSDYSVFSYALQGSSNEFGIIVEGDTIRVTLQNSTFAADVSATAITDGAWHFVALTWQETSAQLYFDGAPAGAPLQTSSGFEIMSPGSVLVNGELSLRPGGVLVLGQDQDGLNSGFMAAQALQGGLDEVGLFDRALSADEVRTIYQATTCGEVCNGRDDDADGRTDEGFLGSSPACPAESCLAIEQSGSAFGTGNYFVGAAPGTLLQLCAF